MTPRQDDSLEMEQTTTSTIGVDDVLAKKDDINDKGYGDETTPNNKKKTQQMSSVSEVFSFVFACGFDTQIIFFIGCIAGIGNGMVYPILAWLFSSSFSSISGASNGLAAVREIAYTFLIVGAFAMAMATIQTGCLEMVASRAGRSFKVQWFKALLRQDAAFFDVHDISGISSSIGPMSNKFRRGLGRKFGEGIQFFVTFLGGLGFAFLSSWRAALVILAILPLCSVAAYFTLTLNQTSGARSAKAYAHAGSVAYSTVSAIKTVISLNALPEMIRQYSEATLEAYVQKIAILWKQGIANGSMLGTFMLLYAALTWYGTSLLNRDVEDTGCDPSGGVEGNETCDSSGPDVFGAMLGIAFAAQGISQVSSFLETFTGARVACHQALISINRKPGKEQETIYEDEEDSEEKDKLDDSRRLSLTDVEKGSDLTSHPRIKAILPKYEIDTSNPGGLKPPNTRGRICFRDVTFSYPTRPNSTILSNFNLEVEAGKTIALVGPSGGGKSTTVSLIERFYDPNAGSIELDDVDIKDLNVTHLRSLIGYVGQEPTLFATTIAGNIRYGNPNASQEQIEEAAKMANAHDFISSFPDGYETQVGDKGAQISGGQKQRIAIARALVQNPKILLLDEATSALDSESEIVVQEALDNVLAEHKRTTIVIAHRLSTIRNADVIAVIAGGTVVEQGTHDELMEAPTGHYRALVEKQDGTKRRSSNLGSRENSLSNLEDVSRDLDRRASVVGTSCHFRFRNVHFSYPTRPGKLVFDNFNLTVRQGETIALVGPSGGGKSTTVALIERFYDPSEGVVEYENVDVKDLNPKWYRDQIGYVGQEPTLFDTTIGQNIAYGAPGVTQEEIEDAAKQANAHNFIMSFQAGYDTPVGERGTQLSGGQKQRIAIARALVKKPKVLLLDEATSALDSESESIVQEALDRLMASKDHTTIVIAHRLSTIRDVDRIAYIAHGKVMEFGSHDELMDIPKGRYKRLVETQRRGSVIDTQTLKSGKSKKDENNDDEDDDKPDFEAELEEEEKNAFSVNRARQMAAPDVSYMLVGSFGSIMAGGVFPVWGVLFAKTIDLLFRRVYDCTAEILPLLGDFDTCDEYIDTTVDDMRESSFKLGAWWILVAVGCVVGNLLVFYGFGMASERLNKRVRDSAFSSLIRQEVAFFDKRSVGTITSRLEEDAARIHTFSGEPIRSLLIAVSSVLSGIVISFIFMWPFALLSICTIPFMGFATEVEMRTFLGEDESGNGQDELNSPGGIIVETLLNIRTVSALTLEKTRFEDYERALDKAETGAVMNGFKAGSTSGLSMLIQQWVNALQMWWGGWLLFNFSSTFTFEAFLISMFSLLFSLFGLGAAFQGMSDRKETEKSAGRIFYLLDRKSEIDPLSEEGKKLTQYPTPPKSDPADIRGTGSFDQEIWA